MRGACCRDGRVEVASRSRVLGCDKLCQLDETRPQHAFVAIFFAKKGIGNQKIRIKRENYEHQGENRRPLNFP
jgi:hypothetical protein